MQSLLERAPELARLDAALDRAVAGDGAVLLVEGPAGSGRTALLGHVRRAAGARGVAVLHARGSALEREFAFGVMRQLFDDPAAAFPAGDAFETLDALYRLVAARAPVAVVVDDLQHADEQSLRALAYLGTRAGGLRVLVIAACEPGEAPIGADETLRPAPLSAAAVGALVPEGLGDAAWNTTRGNPLLVAELARALAAAPASVAPEAVEAIGAPALARPVRLRLGSLPPACSALARAVAVLEPHAELVHARALAGLDAPEAAAAADALAAAGFLEGGRPLAFRQPLVRAAVRADMTASERAALHGAAAVRLRGEGLRAADLAPHLLAGEPAGDPATVALLRAAASGAPPAFAVTALARALREPPLAPEIGAVLAELAEAEWLSGAGTLVEHLEAALEHAAGPRADLVLSLHRALFVTGRFPEAFALLERELPDCDDADRRERMETGLASIALLSPATVGRLPHFDVPGSPGEWLRVACWRCAVGSAEATIAAGRAALAALRDEPADSIPRAEVVWVLAYADADELARSALPGAQASAFGRATACGLRALVALRRGDIATAEAEARAGAAAPGLSTFVRPLLFGTLAQALVARGEFDAAEAAIAESGCGPDLPEFVCLNPVFHARGLLRLAQGRCEDALADFSAFGERSARIGLRNPGDPWRLGAAEALTRLGCRDEAAALTEEHLAIARRWGTPTAVGIALHGHALAAGAEPEPLAAAAAVLADAPDRLAHAHALVDLGAALRRANRRTEARDPLRDGLELANRCGAQALVERAQEELRVAGARPRRLMFSGPEALTPGERRVAELAASGGSNRDIADALYVTAKTVDNHLGRVYAKLGISSRAALAAALADPP